MNGKKRTALFFTLALLAGAVWAGGSGDKASQASAEKPHHIVMAYIGMEQPDMPEVQAAISAAALRDINMTVEFINLGFGDYASRIMLMIQGNDELDVIPIFFTGAGELISGGMVYNLNDYIYDYGKDVLAALGPDVAVSGAINGFVYGTPANKESASRSGVVMRKDIVDACGIDVSKISTLADLTDVFAKVKAKYPTIDCIAGTNLISQTECHDSLLDGFGVLMDGGQSTKVVNWYESNTFINKARLIREWYKKGYVKLDAATTTEDTNSLVRSGTLFSYLSPIKPGFLIQANSSLGHEMITAYIGNEERTDIVNNLYTYSVNFFNWGIPANAKDPVKSMQFINWCYKSPEFNNLINFGIEGKHYVFVNGSKNIIDFPPGINNTNYTYHLNMGWLFPNQFIGYVWNGLPVDIWDQYRAFNDSARKSKAFGFMYDPASVQTILAGLSSISSEYVAAISTGAVEDPDKAIKEMNEKFYAAGLQKVMDLKQKQLDAWLANKK